MADEVKAVQDRIDRMEQKYDHQIGEILNLLADLAKKRITVSEPSGARVDVKELDKEVERLTKEFEQAKKSLDEERQKLQALVDKLRIARKTVEDRIREGKPVDLAELDEQLELVLEKL